MKSMAILILLGSLILAACARSPVIAEGIPTLTVTDGMASKRYTAADLQKLNQAQLEQEGVVYIGVPVPDLLRSAGYDPTMIVGVQAVASDGFTANYDYILIQGSDTLLAYARLDGPLSDDEGPFRMVLPGQARKLNPRMVVELHVTHP
jgi:hypothetical protein